MSFTQNLTFKGEVNNQISIALFLILCGLTAYNNGSNRIDFFAQTEYRMRQKLTVLSLSLSCEITLRIAYLLCIDYYITTKIFINTIIRNDQAKNEPGEARRWSRRREEKT